MNLGERIAALRAEHRWSQGDLAEKLDVSRQSVSKWETSGSVPDLEKLLRLSEVFCVSLDELVKGDGQRAEEATVHETPAAPYPPRKIAGWILLGVGLLSAVLGLALNLLLLFVGAYLVLCGIICLLVSKHPGLVIGWGTFLLCAYFLPRMTSARMRMVFQPYVYQNIKDFAVPFTVACGFWVLLLLLTLITVKRTRLRTHPVLFGGWVMILQVVEFVPLAFRTAEGITPWYRLLGWASLLLLAAQLFFTGRFLYQSLKRK